MMLKEQPDYLAYLLRLWRVSDNDPAQPPAEKPMWRASLENPHTGERQGFAGLDELFEFLQKEMGTAPDWATRDSDSGEIAPARKTDSVAPAGGVEH